MDLPGIMDDQAGLDEASLNEIMIANEQNKAKLSKLTEENEKLIGSLSVRTNNEEALIREITNLSQQKKNIEMKIEQRLIENKVNVTIDIEKLIEVYQDLSKLEVKNFKHLIDNTYRDAFLELQQNINGCYKNEINRRDDVSIGDDQRKEIYSLSNSEEKKNKRKLSLNLWLSEIMAKMDIENSRVFTKFIDFILQCFDIFYEPLRAYQVYRLDQIMDDLCKGNSKELICCIIEKYNETINVLNEKLNEIVFYYAHGFGSGAVSMGNILMYIHPELIPFKVMEDIGKIEDSVDATINIQLSIETSINDTLKVALTTLQGPEYRPLRQGEVDVVPEDINKKMWECILDFMGKGPDLPDDSFLQPDLSTQESRTRALDQLINVLCEMDEANYEALLQMKYSEIGMYGAKTRDVIEKLDQPLTTGDISLIQKFKKTCDTFSHIIELLCEDEMGENITLKKLINDLEPCRFTTRGQRWALWPQKPGEPRLQDTGELALYKYGVKVESVPMVGSKYIFYNILTGEPLKSDTGDYYMFDGTQDEGNQVRTIDGEMYDLTGKTPNFFCDGLGEGEQYRTILANLRSIYEFTIEEHTSMLASFQKIEESFSENMRANLFPGHIITFPNGQVYEGDPVNSGLPSDLDSWSQDDSLLFADLTHCDFRACELPGSVHDVFTGTILHPEYRDYLCEKLKIAKKLLDVFPEELLKSYTKNHLNISDNALICLTTIMRFMNMIDSEREMFQLKKKVEEAKDTLEQQAKEIDVGLKFDFTDNLGGSPRDFMSDFKFKATPGLTRPDNDWLTDVRTKLEGLTTERGFINDSNRALYLLIKDGILVNDEWWEWTDLAVGDEEGKMIFYNKIIENLKNHENLQEGQRDDGTRRTILNLMLSLYYDKIYRETRNQILTQNGYGVEIQESLDSLSRAAVATQAAQAAAQAAQAARVRSMAADQVAQDARARSLQADQAAQATQATQAAQSAQSAQADQAERTLEAAQAAQAAAQASYDQLFLNAGRANELRDVYTQAETNLDEALQQQDARAATLSELASEADVERGILQQGDLEPAEEAGIRARLQAITEEREEIVRHGRAFDEAARAVSGEVVSMMKPKFAETLKRALVTYDFINALGLPGYLFEKMKDQQGEADLFKYYFTKVHKSNKLNNLAAGSNLLKSLCKLPDVSDDPVDFLTARASEARVRGRERRAQRAEAAQPIDDSVRAIDDSAQSPEVILQVCQLLFLDIPDDQDTPRVLHAHEASSGPPISQASPGQPPIDMADDDFYERDSYLSHIHFQIYSEELLNHVEDFKGFLEGNKTDRDDEDSESYLYTKLQQSITCMSLVPVLDPGVFNQEFPGSGDGWDGSGEHMEYLNQILIKIWINSCKQLFYLDKEKFADFEVAATDPSDAGGAGGELYNRGFRYINQLCQNMIEYQVDGETIFAKDRLGIQETCFNDYIKRVCKKTDIDPKIYKTEMINSLDGLNDVAPAEQREGLRQRGDAGPTGAAPPPFNGIVKGVKQLIIDNPSKYKLAMAIIKHIIEKIEDRGSTDDPFNNYKGLCDIISAVSVQMKDHIKNLPAIPSWEMEIILNNNFDIISKFLKDEESIRGQEKWPLYIYRLRWEVLAPLTYLSSQIEILSQ